MARITLKMKFSADGTCLITKGDGTVLKVTDPAKLAKITEELARKMGPIIERHAAHSHIHLDPQTGKMVHEQHEHND
jgi:hypothetical protein